MCMHTYVRNNEFNVGKKKSPAKTKNFLLLLSLILKRFQKPEKEQTEQEKLRSEPK